jgi:tRNA/tmRNA/rRNA uracil-C5-methylase (TrmA/RlmC/RlmD family)
MTTFCFICFVLIVIIKFEKLNKEITILTRSLAIHNLASKQLPIIADLYCGFAIYSFALHHLIKESHAFDGNQTMINLANQNSHKYQLTNKIKAYQRDLFFNPLTAFELNKYSAVIINPPRNGASAQILQIAKSDIRNICYVSCNIYSLLTDLKILLDYNYFINTMHAINQFADGKNIELIVNICHIFNNNSINSLVLEWFINKPSCFTKILRYIFFTINYFFIFMILS